MLNVKNYLDFICDDFESNPAYLPINTVTPSEQFDHMNLDQERKFRAFTAELIQDSCHLLRLPPTTLSTALSLMHRFYYRKSFLRCDYVTVATTTIFVAGKVEESPRKVRDVISVVDWVLKKKKKKGDSDENIEVLDINSFYFTDTRQEIFDAE